MLLGYCFFLREQEEEGPGRDDGPPWLRQRPGQGLEGRAEQGKGTYLHWAI